MQSRAVGGECTQPFIEFVNGIVGRLFPDLPDFSHVFHIPFRREQAVYVYARLFVAYTSSGKLSEKKTESLQAILKEHQDLAICYAMKEEMCRLYELTDYQQALEGWSKWFEAAKASEIPALVKFATQKEKRLSGLAAHAVFPISTGKLEGFNNKIKVAKRIAYGYRDEEYFFTLIRYLSLPSVRCSSHNFP